MQGMLRCGMSTYCLIPTYYTLHGYLEVIWTVPAAGS